MKYKLIVFDFDGTLIEETSIWQFLHDFYDTDKVKRKKDMEDFFAGKITYKDWFEIDIENFKNSGANKENLFKSISHIKKIPGADEVINELKKRGYKLAIISGSLNFFVEKFFPNTFDHVLVNKIFFDEKGEILRGEATPFDMEHKATGLKLICKKEKISPEQCIFIGDHFNDVEIAQIAGLSIAFNPKIQKLEEVSDVVVKKKDLREILKYIP